MMQFTQKYAIIQLFEEVPVGTVFSASNWPLHSTIADTFAVDWDAPTMVRNLTEQLSHHAPATSEVEGDRLFGENSQVRVALLNKTDELVGLHRDVIAVLQQGGWKPNDPQFAGVGFLPHSTVQPHARLMRGEAAVFDSLSLIDFFPGEDPYMRKVLATIPLGS
jgi:2'-5' RNA ligase